MPDPTRASLRLLIHGENPAERGWWDAVLSAIDSDCAVTALVSAVRTDLPDRVRQVDGGALSTQLDFLTYARDTWPGADLLLLRTSTTLPPHWFARIRAALAIEGVLAAGPMDNLDAARSPLAGGQRSDASVEHIDAHCLATSRRILLSAATLSPLLSAWHGERLLAMDPARIDRCDDVDHRRVLLDHLFVADPDCDLRGPPRLPPGADPLPDSPLGELRRRLATALDQAAPMSAYAGLDGRPVVLHILHGWGGGAERFVRDLASADSHRSHLVLLARGNFPRRRFGEVLELFDGSFRAPALRRLVLPRAIADTATSDADWREFFSQILQDYAVDTIMVSSLIGHSLDALRSGLPTVVVGHDCYPLWPVLHRDFGDRRLRFDAAQLAADLGSAGADFEFSERSPAVWQRLRDAYAAAMLSAKAKLVFPSHSARNNYLHLAPALAALDCLVIEHGLADWPASAAEAIRTASPEQAHRAAESTCPLLRLLVPGRVRRGKGADLLRAALPELRRHAQIFLLGAGAEGHEFFGESDVHVLLDYRHAELPQLIQHLRPDAALILATVAETFSYTLSECWSLGLPVIATRVGALAERIIDGETGVLVEPTAQDLVHAVAQLAGHRERLPAIQGRVRAQPTRSLLAMVDDYSKVLPLRASAGASAPVHFASTDLLQLLTHCDALHATERHRVGLQQQLATLQAAMDQRAEWASSLEREQSAARAALRTLQSEFDERSAWLTTTQDELKQAHGALSLLNQEFDERSRWALSMQSEIEQMQQSTSWRMTRPVRALMRRYRALRARLGFYRARLRGAWQRSRSSLARRGWRGTIVRAWRELRQTPQPRPTLVTAPDGNFSPFVVPCSTTPTVSIVIPVFNKVAYTVACLRSIATHADAIGFEVIVVDDASCDDTATTLAQIDGLQYLRNGENLGFVGSCNAGAAIAKGDFVLFLNNDTVVTTGWLTALLRCFAQEPDAGLVGAKLVYPDGRLQEAGGIVFRDGSGWNYGRFDDPADPRYNFRREADYCSGAAIVLRRELFERLGGFDTRYAPAYYEDTDLAFAVRAAGLKVYYEPSACVIHFEGITAGTDTASGMKRYQLINRDKFLDKWNNDLLRQPAPIDTPDDAPRAATFRARKRILIIDACTPTPDHDSGSLRMINLMRLLRALGWQVTFFADNRLWLERYTAAMQELGVEAQFHPYLGDPIGFFRARGGEFDAILLSRHYIAINYLGLARLYAPQARLIFDTVDLHYLREQRAAELTPSADLQRKAETTRLQEHKLMRSCDLTLVVSPIEQELLARELPQVRVEILSNVHEVFGSRRAFDERRDLLFVGSFAHPPNTDAVLWFVREVLPRISVQIPDLRLHVIGQPPPPEVLALAGDNVIVHGYVANLEPYLDGCRISVAPLRYGAGVKGKVNMAMSYGLPVVATGSAVEGMHIVAGQDVLVADSAEDYAAAVLRLYRDEALWQTLSDCGVANVERHFSFAAAKTALEKILA